MTDSNERHVSLEWLGGLKFRGGSPEGPSVIIDADDVEAPGPMRQLLLAAAACCAADVVSILSKMKVELAGFSMDVTGTRRAEHPRRYLAISFVFRLVGAGLDETKARRAIDLSIESYCSVIHSLAPDITLSYDVVVSESPA